MKTLTRPTRPYLDARGPQKATEVTKLIAAAVLAHERGLRVNAGHGLNYENTPGIFVVPHLDILNIGHAIISRAVFVGLRQAVSEMLKVMASYRSGT